MPVEFPTDEQAGAYGKFAEEPTRPELERFFFLDDVDRGCNIGLAPVVNPAHEALTRARLVHVDQYYLRADPSPRRTQL